MSMIGQVIEELNADKRTQPVVFVQMTWSAGDHMVARPSCKSLNDIKGKKIALQKSGPHVGMLHDLLHTAQLTWKDITPVWTDDVTGDKGPAELFRKDEKVDACFAITPDMMALTGGDEKTGTGAEKTVKGAKVLVSTKSMLRSIADVYACRKDFYDKNKPLVEKLTAGYLKGTELVLEARKENKPKEFSAKYKEAIKAARTMFGKDVPSDDDADGLISDAVFVGLAGNYSFFKDKGNLSGFESKMKAASDIANQLGDARGGLDMLAADFEYAEIKKLGDLTSKVTGKGGPRFSPNPKEKNTLFFFTVAFKPNQATFPEEEYGKDFKRAVEQASLFGNAIVSVRGHADPFNVAAAFKEVATEKKIITEKGGKYFLKDGKELDLNDMKKVVEVIDKEGLRDAAMPKGGTFGNELDFLFDLSKKRSDAVRKAVVEYAKKQGYRLDESQIKFVGLGPTDPVIVFPKDREDYTKNRRVEFRIVQVAAEDILGDESTDN